MNTDAKQELETRFKSRHFIPANEDLANRIISAAALLPQQTNESILVWLGEIFEGFTVLKPAYTLGLVLVLGLSFGFAGTLAGTDSLEDSTKTYHVQDFLYVKRSFP